MEAPSWRLSVGRATLTMVLSTTTRNTERQRTGSTIQRRASMRLLGAIGSLAVGTISSSDPGFMAGSFLS